MELKNERELLNCTKDTHHECYCPENNCDQQTRCVLIDHSKIVLRNNGFVVYTSHVVENVQEKLDEHRWDWCAQSYDQRTWTESSSVRLISHFIPIEFCTCKRYKHHFTCCVHKMKMHSRETWQMNKIYRCVNSTLYNFLLWFCHLRPISGMVKILFTLFTFISMRLA